MFDVVNAGGLIHIHYHKGSDGDKKPEAVELSIPTITLTQQPSVFTLLQWQSGITGFHGRDEQLNELAERLQGPDQKMILFITGPGGIGKSLFGAKLAERMQGLEWAAGVVDRNENHTYKVPKKRKGVLLVVDYPEEHPDLVREILEKLRDVELKVPYRIVFLTRRTYQEWEPVVIKCRADLLISEDGQKLAAKFAEAKKMTRGQKEVRARIRVTL